METLSYKSRLIFFLPFLLILTACHHQHRMETDDPQDLFQIISKEDLTAFKDVFVVSTFQCKGCVIDKVQEFVNIPDLREFAPDIAFVIDTGKSFNSYYKVLKDLGFKVFYASSQNIDKYFPRIANIALLRRDAKGEFEPPISINAEDSSMLYFIKGGKKPEETF